jgi:hypothetical protein
MPTLYSMSCEPFRAWNRLEVRPRKKEFDEVLRARIHDPLWMLTRQWQFGEFQGEDTGSAIFAKVKMETTSVTRLKQPDGSIHAFDETIPLETRVERMPVQYDIRFRASAGQYWLKLMRRHGNALNTTNGWTSGMPEYFDYVAYQLLFANALAFELPEIDVVADNTTTQIAKARLLFNTTARQHLSALGGRTPDGVLLFNLLNAGGGGPAFVPVAITTQPGWNNAHNGFMLTALQEYHSWFRKTHHVPDNANDTNWSPRNLEYSFSCSLPNINNINNTVIEAKEYYSGHLDWYAFDHALNTTVDGFHARNNAEAATHTKSDVLTLIPTEARFGGMPNSRWWQFEDGYTDLGNITAETTDIAKILLAEFALMYSNDWFVIPYVVPAGSLSEVKGIIVTDTFGQKTLVEAAGQGDANDWTSWTMFNLSLTSESEGHSGKTDPRVFFPPAAAKVHESDPLESVLFLRDEMANMVWALEDVIPDLLGGGRSGNEAAIAFQNWLRNLERDETPIPSEVPEGVKLRFELGNTVPENWIPFLATHLPGQNRAIQLQRASMPRWFNSEFSAVRPVTAILRAGMNNSTTGQLMPFVNPDAEQQQNPSYVFEEEIPRSGIRVEASWQRTRWYDGSIHCWYGYRKEAGKGEGSSGLAFDRVLDVDYENQEALVPAG